VAVEAVVVEVLAVDSQTKLKAVASVHRTVVEECFEAFAESVVDSVAVAAGTYWRTVDLMSECVHYWVKYCC